MRRRDVLAGGAAVAVAGSLPITFEALAASRTPVIDAHCHIFNGDDLPIAQFVEKVVVKQRPEFRRYVTQYGNAITFFIRYMSDWIHENAPNARSEIALLDRIKQGLARARTPDEIRRDEIRALAKLIEQIKQLHIRNKTFTFRENLVSPYLPAVIVGLMHREAYPLNFRGKGYLDNSDHAFEAATWQPSDQVAQKIYDEGSGDFSRYLRWGLLFTRNRSELADTLDRIHGGRTVLLTPAVVDYSNWLDDKFDVKIADQVEVMGRIARRGGRLRVHGFAPFDPLREALHRAAGKSTESPLNLAKRAVREEGFIGVKLYPPMGFLPYQNATKLSFGDFPAHLENGFRRTLNRQLDAVLDDLYAWCVEEQVPILAHASDSNGPEDGYSKRANPDNWGPVLKKYPALRLCLGHFGDFDDGFKSKGNANPKLSDTWEWKMAKLIHDYPDSRVYVDVSYYRAPLLGEKDKVRVEVQRMFGELLKAKDFSAMPGRILFGTDWVMFGQEQFFVGTIGREGHYADRIFGMFHDGLKLPELDANRIMFGNAAEFLGLKLNPAQPNNNRARLQRFYSAHQLPAEWLNQFGT